MAHEEEFDAETQSILSIFYAFGFYHHSPSTTRKVYGILMCAFAIQMYILGAVKEVIMSWLQADILKAMVNAAALPFCLTLQVQIITFVRKQPEVIKILKELQSLSLKVDKDLATIYKREYQNIVTFYKCFLASGTFVLVLMRALGFQALKLIVPALYDVFAEGSFLNFFLLVSVIQTIFILIMFTACDLLHILCLTKIGKNFESLAKKLRKCADEDSNEKNEKALNECIDYHCNILT